MLIAASVLLILVAFGLPLLVRAKDLPAEIPESPTRYLEERRASVYENLRDLQIEYRMGKLSDEDYQSTKKDLQGELATIMAQIDEVVGGAAA
jgi:hypothetical protein